MPKNIDKKKIALIALLAVIAAAILYLNPMKASPQQPQQNANNAENGAASVAQTQAQIQAGSYILDENEIRKKSKIYPYAPELAGINGYINANSSLKVSNLKGKVVLVDFWTYTCINCIRTLPYLKSWHEKYADDGLVIIGVHTPEFEFEKEFDNVKSAVEKYGLKYAVVQDNNYATWQAYQNRYWPHKYFIDIDGFIRYDHIGEGGYEEAEKKIQELLKEKMERDGNAKPLEPMDVNVEAADVDFGKVGTPEIYFGYGFARGNFGNQEGLPPEQTVEYKLPKEIKSNYAYLRGTWKINKDDSELASSEGIIVLPYSAKVVNIVAGSEQGSEIEVFVDDEPLNSENLGSDMELVAPTRINDFKLYNLVDFAYGAHTIQINIRGKGFKMSTFTFG